MKRNSIFNILIYFFSGFIAVSAINSYAQENNRIDLSGEWSFMTDRNDEGEQQRWFERRLDDVINLPGSMPEKLKGDDVTVHTQWTGSLYDSSYFFNPAMEKYRADGNVKLPFFLTPAKHYTGVAWYGKEVDIPASWRGRRIVLFLERPHIETTVWVNDRKAGTQNSLCVPHEYDLTSYLQAGKCRISIRVDNRIKEINVGPDSHSVTDQTQGNWNGIVGRMELYATSGAYIDDVQVYPNLSEKSASVRIRIKSDKHKDAEGSITLSAESFNTSETHRVPPVTQPFRLTGGVGEADITLAMGEGMLTWDEFNPALYRLDASFKLGENRGERTVQFGMREFKIQGKWFYVNGNKTMLRGTVENCDFPHTGYAPMDVESWERVFRICRSYGLNHVRFHSYCPPEAAFIAADRVGFYLQPEGPSWPNHGPRLGMGQPIDEYLMEETQRLTKVYGNYASFCMLACGNEPAGRWVEWVTDFVEYWEKTDPRRVYTGASVGNGWQWQPRSQYHVKAGARGLDWATRPPETMTDYRGRIDSVKQPYVSHETGQWCVFPNFDEIRKYTGVNEAKNFEIFRDILNENKMGHLARDFVMASGKLQALCYKHEIEKTLRTPDYAGFQLLALNDYSGQGTALVGLTDVFFEPKEYISAEAMRRFCSPTVPLARIPKFTWTNDETFRADVEAYHFRNEPLKNARVVYVVRDAYGAVVNRGIIKESSGKIRCETVNMPGKTTCETTDIPVGNCTELGKVIIDLNGLKAPARYNLEVRIESESLKDKEYAEAVNDWDFWVYPSAPEISTGDIYITDTLDEKALQVLKNGGKALITAAGKIRYGKDIIQHFTPIFWNTSWFKMRPPHTTGILVNEHHPVFGSFPTEYHSNMQWWELLNRQQVMQFTEFPDDFQPLVQSIDTWFISRKAGMMFEANVLNGRLVMTSMDITSHPDKRIAARQLYKSVLDYMRSDRFRPAATLTPGHIEMLFAKDAPPVNMFTKESPDELRPVSTVTKPKDACYFSFDGNTGLSGYEYQAVTRLYSEEAGYGYDRQMIPEKDGNDPFFFSAAVPDGNYRVTVRLGSASKAGVTTVRGESRRLFAENIPTGKGEFKTFTFVINKRNTLIYPDGERVRIKPREKNKLNWDDKLTFEFNGEAPTVSGILIERMNDAITLFLCGNSTVVDQDNEPWASWGQMIPRFFDAPVSFANYAESGEAANSFIAAGRLKKLLTQMKAGDYIFVEFGHNDQKQKGEGIGAYTSFTASLKTFIREARARGAYPVFVTPTQRRSFDDKGKIKDTHEDYPDAMRKLAREENIPLIDLHAMTRTLYEALGVDKSRKAFVHYPANTWPGQTNALEDNTHFNPYGAYQIAKCVITGLRNLQQQGFQFDFMQYLRDDFIPYSPSMPDSEASFRWTPSPFAEVEKPDGN
jgi:lysophospholipase L1-like esterase